MESVDRPALVQVQTGETWKDTVDAPQENRAYSTFSSAMDNCEAISMHFEHFRRIQQVIKDMEPLVIQLKEEKLQAENARDTYAAKAFAVEQDMMKALSRNEELEAEIAFAENELVLRVDAEKQRAGKYQHDQVMAEKALEDVYGVNVRLQKQVLNLQKENSKLQAQLQAVHTTTASQTVPEHSAVSMQNACTSAGTTFNSTAAVTANEMPAVSKDRDVKDVEQDVSAAQGTLQGVKKVQEELMKSVLQQMDALAKQHICLQVGQVLLEDSPSATPATLSPIPCSNMADVSDASVSPVAVAAVQWTPNPMFDEGNNALSPAASPALANVSEVAAPVTGTPPLDVTGTAEVVDSLADGLPSVPESDTSQGEVQSKAGRTFMGLQNQGNDADSAASTTVVLQTSAPRFSPISLAAAQPCASPTIAPASVNSTHAQVASTMTSWELAPYAVAPLSPPGQSILLPQNVSSSVSALQQHFLSPRAATSITTQPSHTDAESLLHKGSCVANLSRVSHIHALLPAFTQDSACMMGFTQPLSTAGLMSSPGSVLHIRPWQPFSMRSPASVVRSQMILPSSPAASNICKAGTASPSATTTCPGLLEDLQSSGLPDSYNGASGDQNDQCDGLELPSVQTTAPTASSPSVTTAARDQLLKDTADEERAQSIALPAVISEEIDAADRDDQNSACPSSSSEEENEDEVPEAEIDDLNYDEFKHSVAAGKFQHTLKRDGDVYDPEYIPHEDQDSDTSSSDDDEEDLANADSEVESLIYDQFKNGSFKECAKDSLVDDPDYFPPETAADAIDCGEFSFDDSSASDEEEFMPELARIQEDSKEACSEPSDIQYGSDMESEHDSDFDPDVLSEEASSHGTSDDEEQSDSESDVSVEDQAVTNNSVPVPRAPCRPIIRQAISLRPACKIVRFSTAGKCVDADKYLRNVGY